MITLTIVLSNNLTLRKKELPKSDRSLAKYEQVSYVSPSSLCRATSADISDPFLPSFSIVGLRHRAVVCRF